MKKLFFILLSTFVIKVYAQPDSIKFTKLNTAQYPGKQDDICFVNEKYGWYGNGSGKMYKTIDGGLTWSVVADKPGTFWRCVAFIDTMIGFAGNVGTDYFPNVKDTIPLYKTIDGGKTWNPVNYVGPYVKGLCALDIVKELVNNHGEVGYRYNIYGVGRVGSPANMIVSHDGGNTFTSKSLNEDCKMLFDIKMFNTQEGIVCAASNEDLSLSNALILYTNNGGKTWEKKYQSNRPYECTWKASFPTREVGFVTIQTYNPDSTVSQQRVAKTIDGGKTWTEINLVNDSKARQFGVGFINPQVGFVGTMSGSFETRDGGNTWTPTKTGRATNKFRIYNFNNKTQIFGIGVLVVKAEF